MRTVYLLVAVVALLPILCSAASFDVIDSSNIVAAFREAEHESAFAVFKAQHSKVYESKEVEAKRFAIFADNMNKATEMKKKNPTANFGASRFADLSADEFAAQYLTFKPSAKHAHTRRHAPVKKHAKTMADIPLNYDWRSPDKGRPVAVTPVKDQGQCGSCWAFSATEATESAWILAGHPAVELAPQQIVDCDTAGSDQGCNGGDTVTAYAYLKTVGIEAETSYPYVSGESGSADSCSFNSSEVVATITGFTYATPGCKDACASQDEEKLAVSLYNDGPVSICVDASSWQMYTSGILTAASGCGMAYSNLDHCVELVGYGTDDQTNQKYWSVRNSWNTSWGEAGYIRLLFGANTCGVADEATQVQVPAA